MAERVVAQVEVLADIHCYGAESNSRWQLEAYHSHCCTLYLGNSLDLFSFAGLLSSSLDPSFIGLLHALSIRFLSWGGTKNRTETFNLSLL